MYYDRTLTADLLDLLRPGQPLAHLTGFVSSQPGRNVHAHLEFRREDSGRRYGGIHLYFGRTAPLEVLGRHRDQVKLAGHESYCDLSPSLLGVLMSRGTLASRQPDVVRHLAEAVGSVNPTFIQGEAVSHAGMMYRYGQSGRPGDPFVAVDSEIRVGFRAAGGHNGTHWRADYTTTLRTDLGLTRRRDTPEKHDAIGFLPAGEIALVEVKDKKGDINRAVVQAAAFVHRMNHLDSLAGNDLRTMLAKMVEQKAEVGLLPAGTTVSSASDGTAFVPVVAAPDDNPDWDARWRQRSDELRQRLGHLLHGLRFWRLSATGEILDDVAA